MSALIIAVVGLYLLLASIFVLGVCLAASKKTPPPSGHNTADITDLMQGEPIQGCADDTQSPIQLVGIEQEFPAKPEIWKEPLPSNPASERTAATVAGEVQTPVALAPIFSVPAKSPAPPNRHLPSLSPMHTVLIIEDDEDTRKILGSRLGANGFKTILASQGEQGLELARKHRPDIVLCDIEMPQKDGYAVLTELSGSVETSGIPVIFLTGKTSHQDMRHGMSLGAEDYLCKPVSTEDLLVAISARIKKQAQQKELENSRLQRAAASIASTMAHELRTPLCSILPIPDLIKIYQQDGDAAGLEQVSKYLRSGSGRLHKAVERFLFYAELAFNNDPTWGRKDSSRGIALEISTETANRALVTVSEHHRKGDLVLACHERIETQTISPRSMNQIVDELVANACKFSTPGTRVHVMTEAQSDQIILTVSDQGRGMDETQISEIRVFRQFDRQRFEQQGFGLGLALVQLIVRQHGGRFAVQSQPGKGTTVRVFLPIAPESPTGAFEVAV